MFGLRKGELLGIYGVWVRRKAEEYTGSVNIYKPIGACGNCLNFWIATAVAIAFYMEHGLEMVAAIVPISHLIYERL